MKPFLSWLLAIRVRGSESTFGFQLRNFLLVRNQRRRRRSNEEEGENEKRGSNAPTRKARKEGIHPLAWKVVYVEKGRGSQTTTYPKPSTMMTQTESLQK